MSEKVTVELPEELAQRARAVAARTSRRLEEVLVEWLDRAGSEPGIELLPDAGLNELAKWLGKLESLSRLAPGWNRQGAPAPSEQAIRDARQFIEALVNDGQPPTRVAASAVGGVGVTRQTAERMAYIEFYNAGPACGLLADNAGDERVLDVEPERGTFRGLLNQVKAYLNG